jgi:hypothetical protein
VSKSDEEKIVAKMVEYWGRIQVNNNHVALLFSQENTGVLERFFDLNIRMLHVFEAWKTGPMPIVNKKHPFYPVCFKAEKMLQSIGEM